MEMKARSKMSKKLECHPKDFVLVEVLFKKTTRKLEYSREWMVAKYEFLNQAVNGGGRKRGEF